MPDPRRLPEIDSRFVSEDVEVPRRVAHRFTTHRPLQPIAPSPVQLMEITRRVAAHNPSVFRHLLARLISIRDGFYERCHLTHGESSLLREFLGTAYINSPSFSSYYQRALIIWSLHEGPEPININAFTLSVTERLILDFFQLLEVVRTSRNVQLELASNRLRQAQDLSGLRLSGRVGLRSIGEVCFGVVLMCMVLKDLIPESLQGLCCIGVALFLVNAWCDAGGALFETRQATQQLRLFASSARSQYFPAEGRQQEDSDDEHFTV